MFRTARQVFDRLRAPFYGRRDRRRQIRRDLGYSAAALFAAACAGVAHGQPPSSPFHADHPQSTEPPGFDHSSSRPKWIAEVRAQRRALSESRQQYHDALFQAHNETLAAQTKRHEEQRRRVLEHLAERRRAHLDTTGTPFPSPATPTPPPPNFNQPWLGGPWAEREPASQRPIRMPGNPTEEPDDQQALTDRQHRTAQVDPPRNEQDTPNSQPSYRPSGWDNRWYYRGW